MVRVRGGCCEGVIKPGWVSGGDDLGFAIAARRGRGWAIPGTFRVGAARAAGVWFAPRFVRLDSLFTARGFLRKMAFSHAAPSPENRCFVRLGLA